MDAWWTKTNVAEDGQPRLRAVAYYRHSAEIGQENSVEIQQDNVRSFADRHDIEIINEFADRGKSGLNAEGRPAFNEMMEWVRTRDDFVLILVLDVSRWGRFQDTDLFQAMFDDVLKRVRNDIFEAISQEAKLVDEHEDFIVINRDFTVLIQPSVPMPDGYGAFWSFRPDRRPVVDITLGVPLSNGGKHEILGYLALPRLMVPQPWVRLSAASDSRIELHGYNGLDLIRELLT